MILIAVGFALGCGGEVETLTLGERGNELDRFREEIQPILQFEGTGEAGLVRNCAMAGCHAVELAGLQVVADPDEDQLQANFRLARTKIDPANPAMSILLTDPLTGSPAHPVKSFTDENDCCYTTLLAWAGGAESPGCVCVPQ